MTPGYRDYVYLQVLCSTGDCSVPGWEQSPSSRDRGHYTTSSSSTPVTELNITVAVAILSLTQPFITMKDISVIS